MPTPGPYPDRPPGRRWPCLLLGLSVGPGKALHYLPHPFVIGGIGVASGLVDGGQRCLVEADGGYREVALLG